MSSSQLRGTILVILSGTLFGMMGYLGTKLFYLHLTVENMLFWRFLVATAWILLSTVLCKKNLFKIQPRFFSIMKIFILGAVSYSGASAFYFIASKKIGTGLAMAIFFSFPVFVTVFSLVFGGWRINKYAFIALCAVMVGFTLLQGQGNHSVDSAGILLAMIAALFFAAYVYGSQHTIKNVDSRLLTLLVCFGNTLIFLSLSCYTKTFAIPSTLSAWFYICAIGIAATAVPIQLLLNGLKYISPIKASILSAFEPIVTLLMGLAFLEETVSYVQMMGILIVLLGAIFIQLEKTTDYLHPN